MRLHRKLSRWQEAGLLSEAQSGAILDYERQHARFTWQGGLAFVGVFAIIVGIISIVASNWQLTPVWLKLSGHLAMLAVLGAALLAEHARLTPLVKELCLLAWSGLVLSFIGLTGQVFHLAGSFTDALLLWIALITPAVVVLAHTRIVIVPWLLATLVTLALGYNAYLDDYFAETLLPYLLAGAVLPALLLVLTRRLEARPELRRQLRTAASLLPLVVAAVTCQFWYYAGFRLDSAFPSTVALNAMLILTAGGLIALAPMDVPPWLERRSNLRLLLAGATALIVLPFLVPGFESAVLAAATFIALWLLVGWIGHRTGNARLSGIAILVVTLRIFVIYVEVFGSLLLTGFGLIASGALLLLMLRFAQRINRKLRSAIAQPGEDSV